MEEDIQVLEDLEQEDLAVEQEANTSETLKSIKKRKKPWTSE